MSILKRMFKPKPRQREKKRLPLSFWLIIAVLAILLLNFALLFPPQISALWFEFELLVIQFLKTPVIMQTWEFIILVFIVARLGWFLMPVVDIPWTSESVFYTWRHEEGDEVYFRTIRGYELVMNRGALKRKLLRWTVIWPVYRNPIGDFIVYETGALEVSESLKWKRYAESLAEELAHLYAEKERAETNLNIEQVLAILKARHGGEEQ